MKVKEIMSNPEILVLLLLSLIRLILFVDYLLRLTRVCSSLGLVLLNVHLLVLHNYALLLKQLHISINTVYIFVMVLQVSHRLLFELISMRSIVQGVLALS